MSQIKLMSPDLANKIAAGEVVESIHSVVKELVENSIDAGATEIIVRLLNAGFDSIQVIDNGKGMNNADAHLAFERHATSKLTKVEDLWHVNTLGFRGEALAAIAAVSNVRLLTADGQDSTLIIINGGKIIDSSKGDMRIGTNFLIENLFYNTPARLKHLKSQHRELADVVNYINKTALAHPDIKFELANDDKVLLKTDGGNNLLKVINDIYGINVAKSVLSFDNQNEDYQIAGFISLPTIYKSTRNYISITVNGRVVKSNELIKTILDAYHTYLPDGKIPLVILNINVDPTLIDVNIHPAKLEVKFSKIDNLKELIFNTIRENLNNKLLIPSVTLSDFEPNNAVISESASQLEMNFYQDLPMDNVSENLIPLLEVKGFVKGTYIIAEDANYMYLIDQHAANERINYEKYLDALKIKRNDYVSLLIPVVVELNSADYLLLEKNFDLLEHLNIKFTEFGNNTIIVNAHPWWLPSNYAEEALLKIVELIIHKERDFSLEKFNDKIAALISCKLSIKANQNISLEEAVELINDLRKTNNPYTCPHGRPVIIKFSNYELEKMFKRAM